MTAATATPPHAPYSEVVQRRAHAVELLTDVIARLPADWGVWPDRQERERLANRLVCLRFWVREGWMDEWSVPR